MIYYKFYGKIKGLETEEVFLVNQIHSPNVFDLNHRDQLIHKIDADAIITTLPNILIGVLTADCLPILVYDPALKIIAAIHAGWKGAYLGVIENTIQKMQKIYGCSPSHLIAKIGPAIAKDSYEVGQEFYQKWMDLDPTHEQYFFKKDSIYFDLPKVAFNKLQKLGLKTQNIENSNIDTVYDENYFSYRQSFKMGQKELGRNIGVISII